MNRRLGDSLAGHRHRFKARWIGGLHPPTSWWRALRSDRIGGRAIIQSLLIPKYADGCRIFAGNSMAVMALEDGAEITSVTWMQTLIDPGATFGHHDPYGDPGGYRTVMACMLADNVEMGLSQKLLRHPGRIVMKTGKEPRPSTCSPI